MQGGRGKGGTQPWAEAEITGDLASRFARNTLEAVRRGYPNKLDHVLAGPQDVLPPCRLHPSFYGCFDWHSAVHGHWMLARLLRRFPDLPEGPDIRAVLDRHLAPERISVEVAYFVNPVHRGFERTYGWAWLLKLAGELRTWAVARSWDEALRPLAEAVAAAFRDFLPGLAYPTGWGHPSQHGFQPGSGPGLRAHRRGPGPGGAPGGPGAASSPRTGTGPWPGNPAGRTSSPPAWRRRPLWATCWTGVPSTPGLLDLLPTCERDPAEPARVGDRTDPRTVHLDGVNLSRARCLTALAAALGPGDPRAAGLERAARAHARAALPTWSRAITSATTGWAPSPCNCSDLINPASSGRTPELLPALGLQQPALDPPGGSGWLPAAGWPSG